MNNEGAPLSKSLVLSHRQCPRRAWLECQGKVAPGSTRSAWLLKEQGQQVHAAARSLYPEAKRIDAGLSLTTAAEVTRSAMSEGAGQILEAAFVAKGLGVRADVVERGTGFGWRIVEVKSGGGVKDKYLEELAIQYACVVSAGVEVQSVEVMHPSTGRERTQGGSGAEVLVRETVTEAVQYRSMQVQSWVDSCKDTLAGPEPMVTPGKQCKGPEGCPFSHHCGKPVENTDTDRVEFLPFQRKPVSQYVAAGARTITELPRDAFEQPRNELVRLSIEMGGAVVTDELARTIRSLGYPRHLVDFESVSFAVPMFEGMRSHQPVPFQWSCHRQAAQGVELQHQEFLDASGNDPRRGFAKSLLEAVGKNGPVLVFSAFERSRLRELAKLLPDLRDEIMRLADRLVDLLPLARRGYYHPDMRGSWSLKQIAPTLPKVAGVTDYSDLGEVSDGMEAQAAYMELAKGLLNGAGRQELMNKMLRYCATDTANLYRFTSMVEKAEVHRLTVAGKKGQAGRKAA